MAPRLALEVANLKTMQRLHQYLRLSRAISIFLESERRYHQRPSYMFSHWSIGGTRYLFPGVAVVF